MRTEAMKLVTIIAEHVLEERLVEALRRLGARGYSVSEARGEGTRGVHASDWEGANLRFETLVDPPVADAILEHLAAEYFPRYAVVAYVSDVQVVRGEKFHRG